jgi:hypothetical protein
VNDANTLHPSATAGRRGATAPARQPLLDSLKAKIVAATAVVLAASAFINAAYDVYAAALKIPKTDAERTNMELFQKYIHKAPLVMMPVPIKTNFGVSEAKFYIYEEGDIHVEYGGKTQWFALPKPSAARFGGFSFIASAHAQSAASVQPPKKAALLRQEKTVSGTTLTDSRWYEDGTTEEIKIDMPSGDILQVHTGRAATNAIKRPAAPPLVVRHDTIDLEKLRANAASRIKE